MRRPARVRRLGRAAAAAVVLCLSGAACRGVVSTTPGALDLEGAARLLQRGSATRSDVARLLGAPQGRGEAHLPGQAETPREVWLYQTFHRGPTVPAPTRARQQVALVFFDGERFDGMMAWSSDDAVAVRSTGDAVQTW